MSTKDVIDETRRIDGPLSLCFLLVVEFDIHIECDNLRFVQSSHTMLKGTQEPPMGEIVKIVLSTEVFHDGKSISVFSEYDVETMFLVKDSIVVVEPHPEKDWIIINVCPLYQGG